MKYILYFLIGYIVLYAVVWLHEVGHALWYRKYNLKNDWWRVQVKPYIFFSTPGGVDAEVWENLKPIQYVLSAYGGLMANALFAIISAGIIRIVGEANEFFCIALWLFMTLHIGEIVSYLFVGPIFLVSDMELVNQHMPKLRIPNLLFGSILTVAYVYMLTLVPEEFRVFVVIWNIVTILSMCAGRMIFTAIAKRRTQ
ncbi:hypothetical protein [Butyrivibrio sp. YAB3001]|uniref:hypothetical protein n=1 Tax=Butyrivibrio sp. YAB3001 TaxID=1520812 RepID=UPI0008F661B1|nr:hypothetical protein [Butyrivibrio sp. YAB3001]SFC29876.1 hypothetical protein SAMN02910398_01943 [Butyrivibrio sp. YAB3001]